MTSSGAVQGIPGQRAGASVEKQEFGIWAWSLENQALPSGPVPSPCDGHTAGSEADPGLAQDAPSGPALPPGNGQIAGSVAELKPSPARDAPSGLAPPLPKMTMAGELLGPDVGLVSVQLSAAWMAA